MFECGSHNTDHFLNDDNLSHHDEEESLPSSQGKSQQDVNGHGLILNDSYREDVMSEGDNEDDLDNPYFQYQTPTAPLHSETLKRSSLGGVEKPPMQCSDHCITATL